MHPRRLAVLVVACATAGCAAALKPLDPGSDLGHVDPALVDPAAATRLAAEAKQLYAQRPDVGAVEQAEQRWLYAARADPHSIDGLIGAVQAEIWLARHLESSKVRKHKATSAVRTAQWCAVRDPEAPECPYYLALALGVQADTRHATAVDGLKHMVRQLRLAIERDPDLDHGGPHRVLARVLIRAPGWPTGPGDPDEGLEHARIAAEHFPDYPPNQLTLAEAYRETDHPEQAREHYQRALELALQWQQRGDPDAAEWVQRARAGAST